MIALSLHGFHSGLGARFTEVGGAEVVDHFGDWLAEHAVLRQTAGVLDLSFRSGLWVRGSARQRFLNGQVTNEVANLEPGRGCYAALTDRKGRMQSDLYIHCLPGELLLDFEPGLTPTVLPRLQRYVLGSDVQLSDAKPELGLLSVQGPRSAGVLQAMAPKLALPTQPLGSISSSDPALGVWHLVHHARLGTTGFDLFASRAALPELADRLVHAGRAVGGAPVGWQALETARIEAGIPRFGVDMDETHLPPEAGIEARAISYTKGCYVGQEVMSRLQIRGQVTRALRGLRLADDLPALPVKGDVLLKDGREVGQITSATRSPLFHANLALGYVRREVNRVGTELTLRSAAGESPVQIVDPPRWSCSQSSAADSASR
jgi:folate-binding protein YgfZ